MSDKPSRPFRRWAARLAFLNLIVIIGVVTWFYTAADEHWLATLMLFGPRWFAFAPLALVLPVALLTRSLWGTIWCAIAAVLIAWPFMGAVLNVPGSPEPSAESPLRMMTFNADYKSYDREHFKAYLSEQKPDVIALQESSHITNEHMLPGYRIETGLNGISLASKFPIRNVENYSDPKLGTSRGAAKFLVAFPRGEREVGVVHLPTPRAGLEAVLARDPKAVETLEGIIAQRNDSSILVRKWMGDCTLIMGDFNLPPQSVIYRRDWDTYKNAFSEAGFGYGGTMFSKRNSVRIDHILFTDKWHCLGVSIGPELGSAHRPVLADFAP